MPSTPAQLQKYASESRVYAISYQNFPEIINGDALASVDSVVCDPTGLTIGSPTIVGSNVQFNLSVGSPNTNYNVSAIATTVGGAILEGVGVLYILPNP